MAASLVGGLLADHFPRERLAVGEPDGARRTALAERFGIRVEHENDTVAAWADVLVLAVKPQLLQPVCRALASTVKARKPLVISIAAGVRSADIERWLGGELPLVRSMPNTPALVQSGATALFANTRVSDEQKELAEGILRAVGLTVWVDAESHMDAVTALSGSGPAYFFLLMELLEEAGNRLDLPPETARLLVLQTAFGAAKLALESDEVSAALRARVTSPGGTTERALQILEEGGIRDLVGRAVTGARDRATELAELLGKDN